MNSDFLYSTKYSDSESEVSDGEEIIRYKINKFQILIDTINREWINTYKSVFDFQVRFNPSDTSLENINTLTLEKESGSTENMYKTKTELVKFSGSTALSIPMTIKNVYSLYLDKLVIPNRKFFLGEGNYVSLLDLKYLSVEIEEFSNVNFGTSDTLNRSFANMIPLSSIYSGNTGLMKFVELKNISVEEKVFKPVPLNCLNSLTIKIRDNLGNQLKFRNEQLTIKSVEYKAVDDKKYLKITTDEYFSQLEYQEGDRVIFNNITSDHSILKEFLEKEQGHKIFYETNFTEKSNLDDLNQVVNIFYITNKISESSGSFSIDITDTISASDGNILNTNLQLLMYFQIENKEKSFENLNTQII